MAGLPWRRQLADTRKLTRFTAEDALSETKGFRYGVPATANIIALLPFLGGGGWERRRNRARLQLRH